MTEETEYVYIIGLGNAEDWEAGRGSLYYIEDRNGEIGMPVLGYSRLGFPQPGPHPLQGGRHGKPGHRYGVN